MTESSKSNCFAGDDKSRCRRSVALWVIVGAMAFVSACIAVQSSRSAAAQLDRQAELADRDWSDAARRVQQVEDLRQSQESIFRHAELAESLLEKTPRSAILADVANALRKGCGLTDLTIDSADADGDSLQVEITGVAPGEAEVGQYVDRLCRSKLLRAVKLSAVQSPADPEADLQKFRINATIEDAAGSPAPAVRPTMTASIAH